MMEEDKTIQQNTDNLSDEDFLKNYEKHHKYEKRSNKYTKENKTSSANIGFWIFLAIAFIVAFYLFSNYLFVPQQ